MAGQVQLAFLLVFAVFVHSDAASLGEQSPPVIQPLEYSVVLDEQFDRQVSHLRAFILKNGLDPMDVIDMSEPLLPDMPGIFKGQVDLKQGWVQNLSKIKRAGHVIAKYSDKILVLDMDLGFDVMDFNYAYHIKYLLFERSGDLYGRFYNLKTKVLVTIDLNDYHISLDSIKFTEVGKYDIKFEGHLLDPILNVATKVVTTVFKKFVLAYIEEHTMIVVRAKLDEINGLIPHPNKAEPNMNIKDIDTFDIKINTLDL
ncbi:uncharacterized protein LOC116843708 [Odontomachus brunneus]|uniref:uncharacterized protein LOC116843708 n=1 Tax=Odontomachus brunneus TaxID=486640 RepID=UPI0013F28C92|nr:uncharacterized protein LOC116843708 [Odontomachus brunneus]